MLLEKIDRWEAEILERGVQAGRQEGELKGRQAGRQEGELKGRLEAIEGFLRAGVEWPVILSATGIDEQTYRSLKRDSANGTEPDAPR